MRKQQQVIFNMATMPPRIPALEESIPRILHQCDILNVYLNEFDDIPKILIDEKIVIFRSQDCLGDIGDCGKFYVENQQGYIFHVDDKLLYPPDYVQKTISFIEKYHRKAVVSWHGRDFHSDRPCHSYYYDLGKFYYYKWRQTVEHWIHELGTGVLAYHSDTCQPELSWFPTTNMTDIWFSVKMQELGIPMLNPPRSGNWITRSNAHDEAYSIHNFCNKNDQYQTQVINDHLWKTRMVNNNKIITL